MTKKNLQLAVFGAAVGLAVLLPAGASAQTSQNVGLDFATGDILVLENDSSTVDLGVATAADFDAGYISAASSPDHTLNVASNTSWQVAVKGDTVEAGEAWTLTGGDCPAGPKAVGTIKYSEDNFSTAGVALTASDVVVETGSSTASQDIQIDYRVDVAWAVDTGICSYDYDSIVYTLSAT